MTTSEPKFLRNGRSTSQISIYDYPEHLNPFYEDENHKRLRFWKLGSFNRRNGDSRRGSFSMAGLKEMWTFKSFRLKKKSSSLGINKTSESPPPLRRNLDSNELHYGTYDPRMRHTTGNNTFNGYFERNAPYRSSLQDMRSTQDIDRNDYNNGFARNDRYRSTIQPTVGLRNNTSPVTPARRYVYGGSVTPQPSIRSNFSDNLRGDSRGSSQLSVSSTNPFDEDENDVMIGTVSNISNGSAGTTSTPNSAKRTPRKKRRAPPPPVPVPKIIIEENSSNPSTPSASQINQNQETIENIEEITNLTAEIENFVKTKTEISKEDEIELANDIKSTKTTTTTTVIITTATNSDPAEIPNKIEIKETASKGELSTETKKDPPSEDVEKVSTANESVKHSPSNDNLDIDKTGSETNNLKELNITVETNINSFENGNQENKQNQEDTKCEIGERSSSLPRTDAEDLDLDTPNIELKITESKEDLSIRSESSNDTSISNGGSNSSRFQVRYVPLKNSSPEPEPEPEIRSHTNRITNNYNLSKESIQDGEVTYERRRSVKEIIESINRSQSLLKVSQEQLTTSHSMVSDSLVNNLNQPTPATVMKPPPRSKKQQINKENNVLPNFKDITESEKEVNRMIREMDNSIQNDRSGNNITKEAEVDELIEKLTDKLNNNEKDNGEIFKKCAIKKEINRESSPTSSNLDWNPVPKPKRTKNLSPELTKPKLAKEENS